jgi:hypothetical protein
MPTVHLSPPSSVERTTASAGNQRLLQLFSQLAQNGKSLPVDYRPAFADTSGLRMEGTNYPWDAKTEIDDSPKELYRVAKAGLKPGSVAIEAMTPPDSPQMAPAAFITKEELKWLFTEALGIKNAQSTSDGKEPASKEQVDAETQSGEGLHNQALTQVRTADNQSPPMRKASRLEVKKIRKV